MDLACTIVTIIIKDKNWPLSKVKTASSLNSMIIIKYHEIIAKMEHLLEVWSVSQVK